MNGSRTACDAGTHADRILEATRELKSVITQQPKTAPLDEVIEIELLRKVMFGKQDVPLPKIQTYAQKGNKISVYATIN